MYTKYLDIINGEVFVDLNEIGDYLIKVGIEWNVYVDNVFKTKEYISLDLYISLTSIGYDGEISLNTYNQINNELISQLSYEWSENKNSLSRLLDDSKNKEVEVSSKLILSRQQLAISIKALGYDIYETKCLKKIHKI